MREHDDSWRTQNAGRLLFASADRFIGDKLDLVHRSGFTMMTEVQLALVQNLDVGGTRLTEIAARAQTTKQSMRELVDKAQALGLVSREPDLGDRRAKIIAFTPAGCLMLDRLRKGVEEAERRMATATRPGFVDALKAALVPYVAASAGEAARLLTLDPWRRENIGRALVSAAAVFTRQTLFGLRGQAFKTVGMVQLALFRNLDLDGTRLTEIARRARMTKQAMLELVDKAEAAGLVERRPDPEDRRAKIVVFTSAGLEMLDQLRHGVLNAEHLLAAHTGQAFMTELKVQLAAYADPTRMFV